MAQRKPKGDKRTEKITGIKRNEVFNTLSFHHFHG